MITRNLLALLAIGACAPMPSAHADGLASCTESRSKLNAEADVAIKDVAEKVPLGPYESASTVLQFVDASLRGVNTPMDCAQIMATYVVGRTNGTLNAPLGPGLR